MDGEEVLSAAEVWSTGWIELLSHEWGGGIEYSEGRGIECW